MTPVDVTVNGRTYPESETCAIAICLDGCEPAYLDAAIADGLMPTLARMRATGTDRLAHSVIPSVHQPEQHVHRHRSAAVCARHLRQLPV